MRNESHLGDSVIDWMAETIECLYNYNIYYIHVMKMFLPCLYYLFDVFVNGCQVQLRVFDFLWSIILCALCISTFSLICVINYRSINHCI